MNIWEELKEDDEALKPIVKKWVRRKKEITLLCLSVINNSCDQIDKTFHIVSDLADFDSKRIHLHKVIIGYLDKYKSQKFNLFPHALDKKNSLKSKKEWAKKLDDLFCLRMNQVINETGHSQWATTIEEMVKAKIFFDSLK